MENQSFVQLLVAGRLASLVAHMAENPPAMQETWVWSLGWEDPLEKEMATHSRILAWRIPWTEEPGGLQSMRSQRVGHDWVTDTTGWQTRTAVLTRWCITRVSAGTVRLSSLPPVVSLCVWFAQSRPTLCDSRDYYSSPGSSVHGILSAPLLKGQLSLDSGPSQITLDDRISRSLT